MDINDTIYIDISPYHLTNNSFTIVENKRKKKNMFIKMKKVVINLFKYKKKLNYGV